jgi:predicted RND superfamily exporter protein
LTDEQKRQVEDLKKTLPKKALTLSDIPEEIRRRFTDKQGNLGAFVFVYPDSERDLWDSKNLWEFTDQVRSFTLPGGKKVTTSGEAVILSDLLRLMARDSPIATTAAFLGVFLVVVLIFGSFGASAYVTVALLFGSLIMVGLVAAMRIKLNFFNFVALPMTFGIGVDYSINNYQRYLHEGPGSIDKVMRRTGSAVILCSLTTIIGYGTLIIADSKALESLGWIAIMGEFTCLGAAMIALPAMIVWMEKRKGVLPGDINQE